MVPAFTDNIYNVHIWYLIFTLLNKKIFDSLLQDWLLQVQS